MNRAKESQNRQTQNRESSTTSGIEHALRVLEFERITDLLVLEAETELGQGDCRKLTPSFDQDEIDRRLQATREGYRLLGIEAPPSFRSLPNLLPVIDRAQKGSELSGLEIARCLTLLLVQKDFRKYLESKREGYPLIGAIRDQLMDVRGLEQTLDAAVNSSGDVLDSASRELASIRIRKASMANRAVERMQGYLASRTRELLSDPVYTTRSGRFVLPLKAENRGKIKGIVHDVSGSGATIYVEPEDVVQIGNRLRELEVQELAEISRILRDLSKRIGESGGLLLQGINGLAWLDFVFAKGRLAYEMRACDPVVSNLPSLSLNQARHPLLDPNIAVPIDLKIGMDQSLLITGPNTGGKTVALKTAGLCVAMLHSGLFPPALYAQFGAFSGLFADIGDEQSVSQSLSTFSGHIRNVSDAIRNGKQGCLILLDELGAGTDPAEGAALAIAILKELAKKECVVLASTHFGELKAFAYQTKGFTNAAMEFDLKTLKPTYRLVLGAAGASQALRIAQKFGIPEVVIEMARSGLGSEKLEVSHLMEELDLSQKRARQSQSEADRKSAELQKALDKAHKEVQEAEEIRRTVRLKGAERLEDALRTMRIEANEIFDRLKSSPSRQNLDRAKTELGELESRTRRSTFGESTHLGKSLETTGSEPKKIKIGDAVRVEGFAQVGTVMELKNDREVQVQLGPLKLWTTFGSIRLENSRQQIKPLRRVSGSGANMSLERARTISPEIHLRQMRAEDAMEKLAKYIDDALLAGLDSIRIVHGKGEGILRKLTHQTLKSNVHVARFREADEGEGGQGVTVAYFK